MKRAIITSFHKGALLSALRNRLSRFFKNYYGEFSRLIGTNYVTTEKQIIDT